MKHISKIIAVASFAVATMFASNVKAQSTTPPNAWRFGIGIEGGVPTGNAHDISNAMLGGTARLQYGVANNVALTLTSGYYNMFGKDAVKLPGDNNDYKFKSLGMVPLKAGIKAYAGGGFYFSAEVGAGFETSGFGDVKNDPIPEEAYKKNTKLILAPGLGYSWSNVDLGVRYENFSGQSNNYGMVAARLAYGFKL
ncbi:hypothetical protein KHS38_01490 [Mucilaginibacter sp. Bleaf8]|uniref:hypothetical protein n=1 Tax=Mucilaginibacter sp. Bleaf8 TaxID=2834430 RepID=UPI001BD000C6|nr:hypothetical protein [Mucilaginibacter sp. Bleaf8]MBS7563064.1 hypothetical protein [Mucilaginibacter sp. Bleaf8]